MIAFIILLCPYLKGGERSGRSAIPGVLRGGYRRVRRYPPAEDPFGEPDAGGVAARRCDYTPAECPNIDGVLFLPVAAGMWKQHELWDGTYTLDDLLDVAELIQVRWENEERAALIRTRTAEL